VVRAWLAPRLAPSLSGIERWAIRRPGHRRAPRRPSEAAARVGPTVIPHHGYAPGGERRPPLASTPRKVCPSKPREDAAEALAGGRRHGGLPPQPCILVVVDPRWPCAWRTPAAALPAREPQARLSEGPYAWPRSLGEGGPAGLFSQPPRRRGWPGGAVGARSGAECWAV
jgi:hypothetical protein